MIYIIIFGYDTDDLITRVNEAIAKGWTPLGGPFVDDGGYHQAMVKEGK